MAYSKTFIVRDYDINANSILKPSVLMRYMQQTAREDLTLDGAAYEVMRNEGMVFVIVRFAMRIYRELRYKDEITVETWAHDICGIIFIRGFKVISNGETVAEATTHWVLMNFASRRIARPSEYRHERNLFPDRVPQTDVLIKFDRDIPYKNEGVYQVRYSDLDYNLHVNNTVYLDIISDYIKDNFTKNIVEFQINYSEEAHLGDIIDIYTYNKDSELMYIKGIVAKREHICFEAQLKLK